MTASAYAEAVLSSMPRRECLSRMGYAADMARTQGEIVADGRFGIPAVVHQIA
ncbi:hypothetical protein ACFFIA_21785 [Phytohabitans kaempferiae]|uniref:Uncharacterized protein n=1 Tax=Phytohabitans kaempferiae TaxID=1620943 RepID=A0ABV6M6H5_9ACTN